MKINLHFYYIQLKTSLNEPVIFLLLSLSAISFILHLIKDAIKTPSQSNSSATLTFNL